MCKTYRFYHLADILSDNKPDWT